MLRVSAVVPCRNAEPWLGEALASVHAQSRPVTEVIVADDASTDGSRDVARRGGARVVTPPTPGNASRARNAGWRAASGDVIAFLDADDRWRPHHVETVAAVFDRHPEVILAFGQVERFGVQTGRFPCELPVGRPEDARASAAIQCTIPQMAVIIRRAALEAVGGYDETVGTAEDYDLFGRLAHEGRFFACPDVTADYRQHPTQDTRRRWLDFVWATTEIRQRHLARLAPHVTRQEFALLEARARQHWSEAARWAWSDASREQFDRIVSAGESLPGIAGDAARWRRRAQWGWAPWHAAAWTWRTLRLRRVLAALTSFK